MPDHVHPLAEVPPVVPVSTFIGALKGRSGRLLRKEFPTVADQRADFTTRRHGAPRHLRPDRGRGPPDQEHVEEGEGEAQRTASTDRSPMPGVRRTLQWQSAKAGKDVVVFPAKDTTQRCSSCGAKAKPRIELSDRVYRCRVCGLVLGQDRNAARNLNPDRIGTPVGGSEPAGVAVPVGDDGKKPKVPAGTLAA